MLYYTSKNPDWLKWIAPESFNDEELFRIVVFYVFHSPCTDLSAMSKSLADYGWSTPWRKPVYLNRQLKQAASNYDLLFSAEKYNAMEAELQKADLSDNFPSDLTRERICIYDNMKNQFMSVFWHLRNAFAHGRLNFTDVNGECVFIFEDVNSKKRDSNNNIVVTARMILRKRTLLKWIEIIENGEHEFSPIAE